MFGQLCLFSTLRGYRRPLIGLSATFSQRSLLAAQFIRSAAFASAVLMLTPWVGWDPAARGTLGGPRGGRALRTRWRTDARFARARAGARCARARRLRRRQGRGAKGPRGALGFFRRLAEWKGIQRGSALEFVFTFSLLHLIFKRCIFITLEKADL